MKNLKIIIPNMESNHCQTRVQNIVKEMKDVQLKSIESGNITVSVLDEKNVPEMVSVIEKLGYTVSSVNELN